VDVDLHRNRRWVRGFVRRDGGESAGRDAERKGVLDWREVVVAADGGLRVWVLEGGRERGGGQKMGICLS
jgi:hypothetical protein